MTPDMDYDKSDIGNVYDEARALAPESLRQWLDVLSTQLAGKAPSLVIDLGCGAGRFTEPLAEHFSACVIGVDPSQKMLDQARRKLRSGRVTFERASAEALPIADDSVDIVFMSMVFHHFANPAKVADECRRVLRDAGYIFIRNSTRESDFPTRRFFPSMQLLIETELPTTKRREERIRGRRTFGCRSRDCQATVAGSWQQFVRTSSLRADSFLARLSDEDYEEGMNELRAHAAAADMEEPVVEEIDLFIFTK